MSEEKKLSAVEWLFENLIDLNADMNYSIITWEEYLSKRVGLLDQAKAMEKQQVINAFGVGCQVESTRLIGYQDLAEQYYNENFGVQ